MTKKEGSEADDGPMMMIVMAILTIEPEIDQQEQKLAPCLPVLLLSFFFVFSFFSLIDRK